MVLGGRTTPPSWGTKRKDVHLTPSKLPSMALSMEAELKSADRMAEDAASVRSSTRVVYNYNYRSSATDSGSRKGGRDGKKSENGEGFAPSQSNGTISGFTGFSGNPPSSNNSIPDEDPYRDGYMWRIMGEYTLPPPKPPKVNRLPPKTDMTLSVGTLVIECLDRMTGRPVPGAAINVSSTVAGTGYNAGSTFGKGAVTDENGMVTCRCLATKYLVTTTCTGYYPYGKLGERLIVDVHHGEVTAARMLLVPIKVGVIMTLLQVYPEELALEEKHREQMFKARGDGGSTMDDGEGGEQENNLFKEFDRRVELTDHYGSQKRGFLATLLSQQPGFLKVKRVYGVGEHDREEEYVDLYNTNSDGRCFFYGPDEDNNVTDMSEEDLRRMQDDDEDAADRALDAQAEAARRAAGPRRIGHPTDSMAATAEEVAAEAKVVRGLIDDLAESAFDDVDGVPEAEQALRAAREPEPGEEPTRTYAKYKGIEPHQRAGAPTPGTRLGQRKDDAFPQQVEEGLERLEAMAAELSERLLGGDSAATVEYGGSGPAGGLSPLRRRAASSVGIGSLTRGYLSGDVREDEEVDVPMGGYSSLDRPAMPDEVLGHEKLALQATGVPRAAAADGAGGGAGGGKPRGILKHPAPGDSPARAPHDIRLAGKRRASAPALQDQQKKDVLSIHHLEPGRYTLYIEDPSYTLLFAARRYGGETVTVESISEDSQKVDFEVVRAGVGYRATINRYDYDAASPAVEDIYTDNTSMRYVGRGPGHAAYTPLELYLRRKPRVQIQVYDLVNGVDVGAIKGLKFVVERWSDGERDVEQEGNGPLADTMWGALMADFPGDPVDADGRKAAARKKKLWRRTFTAVHRERGWYEVISGKLDGTDIVGAKSLSEMWVQVGKHYRVTVFSEHPYVEFDLVQERRVLWEEKPFSFTLERKAVFAVQVKEQFGGQPVDGRKITVDIIPPRPPPPRPRMCNPREATEDWLRSIVLSLVDFCADSEERMERIPTHYDLLSNGSGYARVLLPPRSRVKVMVQGGDGFEENGPAANGLEWRGLMGHGPDEQTIPVEIVRMSHAVVRCLEPVNQTPLADCFVTLLLMEDNEGWQLEPPLVLFEGQTLVDAGDAEKGLGQAMTPAVQVSAGSRLRAVINKVPVEYTVPIGPDGVKKSYVEHVVDGPRAIIDIPTAVRPRVVVKCHDKGNGTELSGVKFRVWQRMATNETVLGEVTTEEPKGALRPAEPKSRARRAVPPLAQSGGKLKLLATSPGDTDLDEVARWKTPRVCAYMRAEGVDDRAIQALAGQGCNGRRLLLMDAESDLEDHYLIGVREKKHLKKVIQELQMLCPPPPDSDTEDEESEPEYDGTGPPPTSTDLFEGGDIDGAQVLYESATGGRGTDVLWVEPFMEIIVQLAPSWPYATDRLRMSLCANGMTGLDPFEFWISRDMRAVDFWLEKSEDEYNRLHPRRHAGVFADDGNRASVGPDPSKDYFLPTMEGAYKLGRKALEAQAMGDPDRLPLERTTLLELMAQWGSFFHVGDGACVACGEDGQFEVPVGGVEGEGPIYTDLEDLLPAREAKYCRSPFHTWVIPSGRAVHVGLHQGLYDELAVLTEKQNAAIEMCNRQVEKIEAYNKTVPMDGRYLFGSDVVNHRTGGIFVIDTSGAVPDSAMRFVANQLQFLLTTWGEVAEAQCEDPPFFNVVVMCGDDAKYWRAEPSELLTGSEYGVADWICDEEVPETGYCDIITGLRTAFRNVRNRLPVFLVAGSATTNVPGPAIWAALDQLRAQGAGLMRTPIHVLEIFDEPLREDDMDVEFSGDADSAEGEAEGGDIFKLLLKHIDEGATRLLELFREEDKNRSNTLDPEELAHLVSRFIPDVSHDQLRYLQVMLDADGSGDISYKEFVVALRECKAVGVAVRARGGLEVKDILRRLKLHMSEHRIDINNVFARFDADNSGSLEQGEILKLIRFLMPSLQSREVRTIMAEIKRLDINNDGTFSLPEFRRALGMEKTGPSPRELIASKARGRNEEMGKVLMTIAAITTGRFLRIETTYLRAASEHVEVDQIKKVLAKARFEVDQILAFERSYVHRLQLDIKMREEERLKRLRKGRAPTIGGKKLLAELGIKPKKTRKKRPSSASLPRVALPGPYSRERNLTGLVSSSSTPSLPSASPRSARGAAGGGGGRGGLREERSAAAAVGGGRAGRPLSAHAAVGRAAEPSTPEGRATASGQDDGFVDLESGPSAWETPAPTGDEQAGPSPSSRPGTPGEVRWATPVVSDSTWSVGAGVESAGVRERRQEARARRQRAKAGPGRRASPPKGRGSPDRGRPASPPERERDPAARMSPSHARAKRVSPHEEKILRAKIAKEMEDLEIPLSAPRAPRRARTANVGHWMVEDGQAVFVGSRGAAGQPRTIGQRAAPGGVPGRAATTTPGAHTREKWQFLDVPRAPDAPGTPPSPLEAIDHRPRHLGERPTQIEWEMQGQDSAWNV